MGRSLSRGLPRLLSMSRSFFGSRLAPRRALYVFVKNFKSLKLGVGASSHLAGMAHLTPRHCSGSSQGSYRSVIFVMFIFVVETVLRVYARPSFFGSFYFNLDTIATATIVIDFLPLLQRPQTTDEEAGDDGEQLGATDAFRAAKSARVGTRIARLVRVLRIIRVLKLFVTAVGAAHRRSTPDPAARP